MKTDDWFAYPVTTPTQSPDPAIQSLLTGSLTNLSFLSAVAAVVLGLTGLASWLEQAAAQSVSWPPALVALMLALVGWLIQGQSMRWPFLVQRVVLAGFSLLISGTALALVSVASNRSTLPGFLLVLLATAAVTVRPLLDHVVSLLIPSLLAFGVIRQVAPAGHRLLPGLLTGLTILLALFIALQQFRLRTRLARVQNLANSQRDQLDQLTQRDPVSTLYNDTAFKSRLTIELARSTRYKRPLCLLAFELMDHNRSLRSTGRNHFELTIADLAEQLNKKLRTTDILGCGQDGRFLIALPDTDLTQAQIAASRISLVIANYNEENEMSLNYGLGISEHRGETIESLILVTEARMREAFRLGPDQMVVE